MASSLTNAEPSRRDQCLEATAWPSTRTSKPPSTDSSTRAASLAPVSGAPAGSRTVGSTTTTAVWLTISGDRIPVGTAGVLVARCVAAGSRRRLARGRSIGQDGVELPGAQRNVGRVDPDLVLNGVAAGVDLGRPVRQADG